MAIKSERPIVTTEEVRDYLARIQGQEITLDKLRLELDIERHSKSFDTIRNIMFQLAEAKIVRPLSRGQYKVITQVIPVPVYSVERERRPPFGLVFPRDFNTMEQMSFAEDIVVREGDIILIAGMSNYFKTGLCLNFCGENIDSNPVLMGNEYTIQTDKGYDVSPRFLNRLDAMDANKDGGWINWTDVDGNDRFTLLPVWDDYAEHIVRNKINIIDWINLPGEYYMISPIMEAIKKALGRGIGILVLQKNEGNTAGRGGALTKDFTDCELLLDSFGDHEVLLTIGKVKESTRPVIGKTFAFAPHGGIKILNFREVKKCLSCKGQGFTKSGRCDNCFGDKYIDKTQEEEL